MPGGGQGVRGGAGSGSAVQACGEGDVGSVVWPHVAELPHAREQGRVPVRFTFIFASSSKGRPD
jgi:hypothetical protein